MRGVIYVYEDEPELAKLLIGIPREISDNIRMNLSVSDPKLLMEAYKNKLREYRNNNQLP